MKFLILKKNNTKKLSKEVKWWGINITEDYSMMWKLLLKNWKCRKYAKKLFPPQKINFLSQIFFPSHPRSYSFPLLIMRKFFLPLHTSPSHHVLSTITETSLRGRVKYNNNNAERQKQYVAKRQLSSWHIMGRLLTLSAFCIVRCSFCCCWFSSWLFSLCEISRRCQIYVVVLLFLLKTIFHYFLTIFMLIIFIY